MGRIICLLLAQPMMKLLMLCLLPLRHLAWTTQARVFFSCDSVVLKCIKHGPPGHGDSAAPSSPERREASEPAAVPGLKPQPPMS